MSSRSIVIAGFLVAAPSCSGRTIGGDDRSEGERGEDDANDSGGSTTGGQLGSSSGQPPCDSPSDCDPLNCGQYGIECGDSFGIGTCMDGHCGPYLIGCAWGVDAPPMSCAEICEHNDRTCVAGGCRGGTAYGWPAEYYIACEEVIEEGMTQSTRACDEPFDFEETEFEVIRCCCQA